MAILPVLDDDDDDEISSNIFNDDDNHHHHHDCRSFGRTQFTPSTNNIAPANGLERSFAVFVILLAMGFFSSSLGGVVWGIVFDQWTWIGHHYH